MWFYFLGAGLVYVAYEVAKHFYAPAGPALPPAACATLTTCPVNIGSPSPTNSAPVAGRASALNYRWCVEVKDGDTAGKIAKAVTGDARRYLELLAANPDIKRVTDSVTGEINFSWPKDCTGLRLTFPLSWTPWMDQTGKPRGNVVPFPPFDIMPPYEPIPNAIVEGRMPDLKGGWK